MSSLKPGSAHRASQHTDNVKSAFAHAKTKLKPPESVRPCLLKEISVEMVENWKIKRAAMVSASTFNKELEVLRGVLDYAQDRELIDRNPARAKSIERVTIPRTEVVCPTAQEWARIVSNLSGLGEGSVRVKFLAYIGARPNEPLAVRVRDVDFVTNTVQISGTKTAAADRRVPMTQDLRDLLWNWIEKKGLKPDEPLFRAASCRKALITACRRAGVPQFSRYALRHFFITQALPHVNVRELADIVGHEDRGVTLLKTYAHVISGAAQEAMSKVTFAPPAPGKVLPLETPKHKTV